MKNTIDEQLRFWKKGYITNHLCEVFSVLTKSEMDTIRKNYQFKNLSSLKKAELADQLKDLIPKNFMKVLVLLDEDRYEIVKKLALNSNTVKEKDISYSNAKWLMYNGIAFPRFSDNGNEMFMPQEIVEVVSKIEDAKLEKMIKRNTVWIKLTQGLLYYYGVVDMDLMCNLVEIYTDTTIDYKDYKNVITSGSDYYRNFQYTSCSLYSTRVSKLEKLTKELEVRSNINYYPFTIEDIFKASDPDYVEENLEMKNLTGYLLKHHHLTDKNVKEFKVNLNNAIYADQKLQDLVEYMHTIFEIASFDFINEFAELLVHLCNNTPRWVLKGYTPAQISRENNETVVAVPFQSPRVNQKDSNIIDIKTRKKIGRNEPCPCGSAKKYKRCCGK